MIGKNKKKKEVHLRLYAEDVREAQRRARELDVPWQAWFRGFVHRAFLASTTTGDGSGKKGKIA